MLGKKKVLGYCLADLNKLRTLFFHTFFPSNQVETKFLQLVENVYRSFKSKLLYHHLLFETHVQLKNSGMIKCNTAFKKNTNS